MANIMAKRAFEIYITMQSMFKMIKVNQSKKYIQMFSRINRTGRTRKTSATYNTIQLSQTLHFRDIYPELPLPTKTTIPLSYRQNSSMIQMFPQTRTFKALFITILLWHYWFLHSVKYMLNLNYARSEQLDTQHQIIRM